jgi:O-antigen ligase
MIRNLLMILYVMSAAEATFELGLGIGLGLSATNLLLYLLIFAILARAVLSSTDIQIPMLGVHVAFVTLAAYASLSWGLNSLFDPTYPSFKGLMTLKNEIVDNFLFFLVFFFGANTYEDAKRIFLFALHLIAIMTFLTIVDASALFDLGIMAPDSDGRVTGPIGGSNQYGAFMAFFVPLFAAMAMGSKGVARLSWWFIFLCGFALLIATGSRGTYVAMLTAIVVGVKFISPFFDRRAIRRVGLQLAVVLILITGSIAVMNLDLVERRLEQSTSTNLDQMSSGRSAIWTATVLVQAENPHTFLYGNGWNSHEHSGIWKSAHNTYLLFLYELGIIGLIMFIVLLATVVRQVRVLVKRTEGKERILMSGVAFGFFGVIVAIMFLDLYSPWFYIWSFLGMSLRIAYEKDREYQAENVDSMPMPARQWA